MPLFYVMVNLGPSSISLQNTHVVKLARKSNKMNCNGTKRHARHSFTLGQI